MSKKNSKCSHLNADGTFKGGFDGCVLHMTSECGGGHSEESAKKICGSISAAKATDACADDRVRASAATATGRVSISTLQRKVSGVLEGDPRFDTGSHGYPEGSDGDKCREPWCMDVLMPDENGTYQAVVRTDDGRTVRHPFTVGEDGTVKLADGPSAETECTQVYSRMAQEHEELVRSGDYPGHPFHGNQYVGDGGGSGEHHEASRAAHEASKTAKTAREHRSAARLHEQAAKLHEDEGNDKTAAYHIAMAAYHRKAAGKARVSASECYFNNFVQATTFDSDAIEAGDYPGHPFHGNQHVAGGGSEKHNEASHAAHEKSKSAKTASQHRGAASAHRAAARAQEAAGHEDVAAYHNAMAHYHDITAGKRGSGGKAKASDPTAGDMVRCQESGVAIPRAESRKWIQDTETKFQWMPGGVNTITASWRKRPLTLTVECDESTAEAVQASFDQLREHLPNVEPFVSVEHREQEAAFRPERFEWGTEPAAGVFCSGMPTKLGEQNVRGRIHSSFSPTFGTDAEYAKAECQGCKRKLGACECAADSLGCLAFPDGVRGSESNPARVTGVGLDVGSLTNKPAFHSIMPVRARQADGGGSVPVKKKLDLIFARMAEQAPQPENNNAEQQRKATMKIKLIKARDNFAAGQEVEVEATEAATLIAEGYGVDAAQAAENYKLREEIKASHRSRVDAALVKAVERGAIAPKDETVKYKAYERLDKGVDVDLVLEAIEARQGTDKSALYQRTTTGAAGIGLEVTRISYTDAAQGYVKAREGMDEMIRGKVPGGIVKATQMAAESSLILQRHFVKAMRDGDFSLMDAIKAADVTDGNLGTLATGLILMRNLGFLKNKLGWMPYITTDLRNEPARYGQPVFTRYITPPGVLVYVDGVGYTATAQDTSQTVSTASTTDRTVTMNKHYAVQIQFGTEILAKTARNLFAEQQGAMFYSLAEQVNKDFLTTVFAASWAGKIGASYSLGANFGLPGVVALKTRFTTNMMPDVGRFALLHSFYHDNILTDSNLVTAKAITALVNKDMTAMESGELPVLYGIKVLESQLAAYKSAALVVPTDPSTIGTVASDGIGFAGNSASMLFVARVPEDYTTVLPGIPSTASIEILTEPDSGLSIMFTKFVNNQLAQVSARCALMYGFNPGDLRQGFILKP